MQQEALRRRLVFGPAGEFADPAASRSSGRSPCPSACGRSPRLRRSRAATSSTRISLRSMSARTSSGTIRSISGVGSVHVLPPNVAQHTRLEADPVVAPAREAGVGPRRRIAAVRRREDEVEQMDRALAVAGEIVAAHRAIGQIVVGALPMRRSTILSVTSGLANDARPPKPQQVVSSAPPSSRSSTPSPPARRRTARCASMRVARRAGIVDRERTCDGGPRAVRPADLVDHGPQRARLHLGQEFAEHLQAGRAGGDDLAARRGCARSRAGSPSTSSCRARRPLHSAGAPQQSTIRPTPPGIFAARWRVDALDVPGRGSRQLAAGEEGDGARSHGRADGGRRPPPSERLCAMSRSAKSWCEAGIWPLSTMSRRASRHTSPMARSFGTQRRRTGRTACSCRSCDWPCAWPMTMLTLL